MRKHTISTSLPSMFPSKFEWMDCIIPLSLYTFALYSFYYSWVKVNSVALQLVPSILIHIHSVRVGQLFSETFELQITYRI